MRERTVWMITIMLLVWSALCLVAFNATHSHAQNLFAPLPRYHVAPADIAPSVRQSPAAE